MNKTAPLPQPQQRIIWSKVLIVPKLKNSAIEEWKIITQPEKNRWTWQYDNKIKGRMMLQVRTWGAIHTNRGNVGENTLGKWGRKYRGDLTVAQVEVRDLRNIVYVTRIFWAHLFTKDYSRLLDKGSSDSKVKSLSQNQ